MSRSAALWLCFIGVLLILWGIVIVVAVIGYKILFKMAENLTDLIIIGVGYA